MNLAVGEQGLRTRLAGPASGIEPRPRARPAMDVETLLPDGPNRTLLVQKETQVHYNNAHRTNAD